MNPRPGVNKTLALTTAPPPRYTFHFTHRKHRINLNTIDTLREYLSNRLLRERAQKIEDDLKKTLMSRLVDEGTEQEGGHRLITLEEPLPYGDKKIFGIKRQRRHSTSLNSEKAMKYLEKRGLLQECTATITVLNEDALLAANFDGRIPDKDLKSLYDDSETFAFTLVDR